MAAPETVQHRQGGRTLGGGLRPVEQVTHLRLQVTQRIEAQPFQMAGQLVARSQPFRLEQCRKASLGRPRKGAP